ncbi:MAG: hypothetical protein PHH24_03700 [Candidatus Moranbacteria bacterium]|jgi:DNA-binding transcriptional regulator PaaX|nr:hypothetical protein [Candidatus Moranbacteria bacterium]MDD5652019.1 hypothetical protein [Candidatus Moranbacteria bacterium]MDX9856014.1 hypothetical protein [Candidatus Moranbacteria bacterium]
MKNKEGGRKLKEKIEEFLYSDSAQATATKFVLASIGLGGVVFGGALLPGLLKIIKGLECDSNYSDKKIENAFRALKRRKFIKIINIKNGKVRVKLTGKGKKRIREFIIDELAVREPEKWDGKWHILVFDIPTELNYAREALRKKIKKLGFYCFQGSVWFYPYPCEDEILTLAEFFEISGYIEIITAEKILHEKELRKHFKLKKQD